LTWRNLHNFTPNSQVNVYPCERYFKCIGDVQDGTGEAFAREMVAVVESIVGTVHQECVRTRKS
jgi:putative lipoic acid-binding regulatory protein